MLTTQVPPHPWLTPFPPEAHNTIEAWFRHGLTRARGEPEAMLQSVHTLVTQALDWSATSTRRQLCTQVLSNLRSDQAGALAYAQSLVDAHGDTRR